VYKLGPLLFWTIITVSCRRYAKDDNVFNFLVENLPKELWSVISVIPYNLATVNALLINCAWPLPTIRFLNDPSQTYIGICTNACLVMGLHTGRGGHKEFAIGPWRQFDVSDEEARYTWAGYNILVQR
jgi:transcriptional regulatory protein LEU3